MKRLNQLALILFVAIAAALATYLLFDPRRYATTAQEAIISTYLECYCNRSSLCGEKEEFIGETAALSRVVIRSRLDKLAFVEFAACKAGLGAGK